MQVRSTRGDEYIKNALFLCTADLQLSSIDIGEDVCMGHEANLGQYSVLERF